MVYRIKILVARPIPSLSYRAEDVSFTAVTGGSVWGLIQLKDDRSQRGTNDQEQYGDEISHGDEVVLKLMSAG